MSKHNANPANLKAAKLKERLPRGWTAIISKRAADFNKVHNLSKTDPDRLPESKPVICKVVDDLNYTHKLWPFVLEILQEKTQRVKENEALLDQLLSA